MDLVFPFDFSWVRPTQLEIPTPDQSVEVMPKEDKEQLQKLSCGHTPATNLDEL